MSLPRLNARIRIGGHDGSIFLRYLSMSQRHLKTMYCETSRVRVDTQVDPCERDYSSLSGAAIYVGSKQTEAVVIIQHCVFDYNRVVAHHDSGHNVNAGLGGSIFFGGKLLLVEHSRFADNEASLGGAVYIDRGAHSIVMSGTQFYSNRVFEEETPNKWMYGSGGSIYLASFCENVVIEGNWFAGSMAAKTRGDDGRSSLVYDGQPHCSNGRGSFERSRAHQIQLNDMERPYFNCRGDRACIRARISDETERATYDQLIEDIAKAGVICNGDEIYLEGQDSWLIRDTVFEDFVPSRTFFTMGSSLAGCNEWPCPPGYACSYTNASLQCTQCQKDPETGKPSLYSDDGIECKLCQAGTEPADNASACVACPPGRHSILGICTECPVGKIPDETTFVPRVTCASCPPHQLPNADSTQCECGPDRYNVTNGPVLCYDGDYTTPANYFQREEYTIPMNDIIEAIQCVPCPYCVVCAGGADVTVAAGYRPGVTTGKLYTSFHIQVDPTADLITGAHNSIELAHIGLPVSQQERARVLFKCPGDDASAKEVCPGFNWWLKESNTSNASRSSNESTGWNTRLGRLPCGPGQHGPLCGSCEENWYAKHRGERCRKCNESSIVFALLGPATVVGLLAFILILRSERQTRNYIARLRQAQSHTARLKTHFGRSKLFVAIHAGGGFKILLVHFQLLVTLPDVLGNVFPMDFMRLVDSLAVVNLDVIRAFDIACYYHISLHQKLLFVWSLPLVGHLLIRMFVSCSGRSSLVSKNGDEKLLKGAQPIAGPDDNDGNMDSRGVTAAELQRRNEESYVSLHIMMAYILYPLICTTVFSIFACRKLDNGESWHTFDYSIDCNSTTHQRYEYFAAFVLVTYILG
eukprot:SAG31_NODE_4323_length_3360_cov_1.501993_2_plen_867_part_00